MSVAVVIPWYENDGADSMRHQTREFVIDWWRRRHPMWSVVIGSVSADEGQWCKGLAVHRGAQQTHADILVVADADVICGDVREPVAQIETLRSGWAVPHRLVYRMSEDATNMMISDGRQPPLVAPGVVSPDFVEIHTGKAGGGLVVLPHKLLDDVPIDPRFCGWGQEDLSWSRALTMIAGHPWRGTAPLLHLWHEPQGRISRGVGSIESYALWQQYQQASTMPAMLDVVDAARLYLQTVEAYATGA
jgi:hypothetical protein